MVHLDFIPSSPDASIMAQHKPKKLPRDVNARVFAIGQIATGEAEAPQESAKAVSGRKGGTKGGRARADKLTSEQRKEIARKAAAARWKSKG
jgi:hypothetical protein